MLGFAKMVEEKGFYLDSLKMEYTVIKDNYDNSSNENISTKFSGPWTGHRRLKITKAESCPAGKCSERLKEIHQEQTDMAIDTEES